MKEKVLLSFSVLLLVLGILLIFSTFNLGKLRIIACDVGQRDSTLIITPGGSQVLIDGGPGKKVLECLSQKMPFWDRTVEMVVLTHPQKDHMEGLISVLENYKAGTIVWTGVKGEGGLIAEWLRALDRQREAVHIAYRGENFMLDGVDFNVLWPSRDKLESWKIGGPGDLNDSSIVVRADFKAGNDNFCAYFTGDIPKEILEGLISKPCEILKVSHHGSKTGTDEKIIDAIKPKIAIIQVGKNSYGHPRGEVLELLRSKGVEIYRNDEDGVIEISSGDGGFVVKKEK